MREITAGTDRAPLLQGVGLPFAQGSIWSFRCETVDTSTILDLIKDCMTFEQFLQEV